MHNTVFHTKREKEGKTTAIGNADLKVKYSYSGLPHRVALRHKTTHTCIYTRLLAPVRMLRLRIDINTFFITSSDGYIDGKTSLQVLKTCLYI